MTEATYNHFGAYLAEATAEAEARLRRWASACIEYTWVRDDNNRATLYFARAESRTTRQMQSLLRTLTARWRLPLGKLDVGRLQPLSVDDYIAPLYPRRALPKVRGHMRTSRPKLQCPRWHRRHSPARALLLGLASS